jgi:hypothetical protein
MVLLLEDNEKLRLEALDKVSCYYQRELHRFCWFA